MKEAEAYVVPSREAKVNYISFKYNGGWSTGCSENIVTDLVGGGLAVASPNEEAAHVKGPDQEIRKSVAHTRNQKGSSAAEEKSVQ